MPGVAVARIIDGPSMKVPPKRKGNAIIQTSSRLSAHTLNESPSEKKGKSRRITASHEMSLPSMKVPPKRKGNCWG